jgi:DNA (cytosine-5)-methyltransferase 1
MVTRATEGPLRNNMQLVLSLFPGIGLLDMAFELEGFCVVRGPDVLWGGDIRRFHPPAGKFDGVIGGPPCQAFSRLAHMVRHNGLQPRFGNLIPEFERVVEESQATWFVMENVKDAPIPQPVGYGTSSTILNNRQCFDEDGEPAKQNRTRRWTFGDRRQGRRTALMIDVAVFENKQFAYAAVGSGQGGVPVKLNRGGKPKRLNAFVGSNIKIRQSLKQLCALQGLPDTFLEHAPFTIEGKCHAVSNGVPLPMGRAIAKAVKEATETKKED